MPEFISISLRIGPFTTTIAAEDEVVEPRAETPDAASARMTGKYSGRAPAITAFTATFSTVYSQATRNSVACMRPTISSGLRLVSASIACDALLGRQHDRQEVGPAVLVELALEVFFGIGLDETRRGTLELGLTRVLGHVSYAFSAVVSPAMISCMTGLPVIGSLP